MTAQIKSCQKCGAEFTASRNDSTVNCPDCRKAARYTSSDRAQFERYADAVAKMGEARKRGIAARTAGDTEAYERAVGDFQYWSARSRA